MGAAADRAKEIRVELEAAEAAAKAERRAELIARRERERAADIADSEEYRKNAFEVFAGSVHSYIGASSTYNGGVELDLVEWKSSQGSVALTREETLALIEGLQKLVK
jgi:hypothetical protein